MTQGEYASSHPSAIEGERPVPLRRDRDFRLYWAARLTSIAGSLVTLVAMPVLVYRMTHSPALTALTTTLEALPYLLFGLVAGALGDRWNRKRVMVVTDLANVVVIGSIPVASWLGVLTVPQVLVAGLLAQSIFTFFDGSNFGALPVLVGRERVGEANSALWGFGGVLDLTVPASVGLALTVLNPADLLAADALSFLASALAIRAIGRALSSERQNLQPLRLGVLADEVRAGLRFLWGHAGVRSQSLIGLLQSVAGAGFMALVVPFSDLVLHIGTSGWRFGVLYSVWGIGGILASAITPRLLRRFSPAALTLGAIPVSGLAGCGVAISTHWLMATIGMVVWGLAYQLVLINALNYRQQVTPEHLSSRVNTAGRMLAWGVGWTGGALLAGALATQVGVRTAMISIVSVGLLAAAFAWFSPLRRIALLPRQG